MDQNAACDRNGAENMQNNAAPGSQQWPAFWKLPSQSPANLNAMNPQAAPSNPLFYNPTNGYNWYAARQQGQYLAGNNFGYGIANFNAASQFTGMLVNHGYNFDLPSNQTTGYGVVPRIMPQYQMSACIPQQQQVFQMQGHVQQPQQPIQTQDQGQQNQQSPNIQAQQHHGSPQAYTIDPRLSLLNPGPSSSPIMAGSLEVTLAPPVPGGESSPFNMDIDMPDDPYLAIQNCGDLNGRQAHTPGSDDPEELEDLDQFFNNKQAQKRQSTSSSSRSAQSKTVRGSPRVQKAQKKISARAQSRTSASASAPRTTGQPAAPRQLTANSCFHCQTSHKLCLIQEGQSQCDECLGQKKSCVFSIDARSIKPKELADSWNVLNLLRSDYPAHSSPNDMATIRDFIRSRWNEEAKNFGPILKELLQKHENLAKANILVLEFYEFKNARVSLQLGRTRKEVMVEYQAILKDKKEEYSKKLVLATKQVVDLYNSPPRGWSQEQIQYEINSTIETAIGPRLLNKAVTTCVSIWYPEFPAVEPTYPPEGEQRLLHMSQAAPMPNVQPPAPQIPDRPPFPPTNHGEQNLVEPVDQTNPVSEIPNQELAPLNAPAPAPTAMAESPNQQTPPGAQVPIHNATFMNFDGNLIDLTLNDNFMNPNGGGMDPNWQALGNVPNGVLQNLTGDSGLSMNIDLDSIDFSFDPDTNLGGKDSLFGVAQADHMAMAPESAIEHNAVQDNNAGSHSDATLVASMASILDTAEAENKAQSESNNDTTASDDKTSDDDNDMNSLFDAAIAETFSQHEGSENNSGSPFGTAEAEDNAQPENNSEFTTSDDKTSGEDDTDSLFDASLAPDMFPELGEAFSKHRAPDNN
jgi:hypothetical protein